MLKRLPVKKEILFAAGCALLLWAGYLLAFRNTWQAWQLHRKLTRQLAAAADVTTPPGYLERKERNLSILLQNYTLDTAGFRSQVMAVVSPMAEKAACRVVAVPGESQGSLLSGGLQVQRVSFEGSFAGLERLLRQLESTPQAGWLRSAVFRSEELPNHGSNSRRLILEVYLLAIRK